MRKLLLTVLLGAVACAHRSDPASGAGDGHAHGQSQSHDHQVEAFDRVELSGAFETTIIVGTPRQVIVEADEATLAHVTTRVRHGELEVGIQRRWRRWSTPKVTIVTPDLSRVEANGSNRVSIEHAKGPSLDLELNGSANVVVDGKVDRFAAEINGSGRLDAHKLRADDVGVQIHGSGHADVTALAALDAQIYGSGRIAYAGAPAQVTHNVAGSGWVRPATAD